MGAKPRKKREAPQIDWEQVRSDFEFLRAALDWAPSGDAGWIAEAHGWAQEIADELKKGLAE